MENRVVRILSASLLVAGLLTGCASAPTGEPAPPPSDTVLADARAQVAEAQAAGYAVDDAALFLQQAEQAAAAGDQPRAGRLAKQAVRAVDARRAIEEARPVVARAVKEAGGLAFDATKVLEAAEAALKAGDPVRASELAAQARRQAETAMEQKRADEARAAAAAQAVEVHDVVRGDSLWVIAGWERVYGNPLHWPLLFLANRTTITDPDLISPGQRLQVRHDYSQAEVNSAVHHARTRGPWQVGPVEAADREWLP